MKDLNPNSKDVIGIFDRISEIEKKGFDMLVTVPDNGATCSTKIKYHITTMIQRAKEISDNCIVINLDAKDPLELNVCHISI